MIDTVNFCDICELPLNRSIRFLVTGFFQMAVLTQDDIIFVIITVKKKVEI